MGMQWIYARFAPVLLALACAAGPRAGQAQVHGVEVQAPRPAGWMTGDVIPLRMRVAVDAAFPLQRASLPKPGPLNYWLELRSVDVQERAAAGGKEYLVALDYQTFYVPLDVNTREIPALALTFGQGRDALQVRSEPWSFSMSPLRGVLMPDAAKTPLALRPDAASQLLPVDGALRLTLAFAGASTLLLIALAWHYAAWPFHERRARPFARALRGVRAASRDGSPQAYRQALLHLHRAFDAAAGKRLLAADVAEFLAARQAFGDVQGDLVAFFQASRRVFFANEDARAMDAMPWPSLTGLAARLAAAERRMP
ncbi:mxaA protein [Pollutimonas bauzanensis]|uniref:MxaA protein n=2 Tax=Pollutimonas bauzanensis TaxID=658167 RepID=A0A1M5M787_9BURK|nr:mxaA protein [Pollutimonas bauzanensis]